LIYLPKTDKWDNYNPTQIPESDEGVASLTLIVNKMRDNFALAQKYSLVNGNVCIVQPYIHGYVQLKPGKLSALT